MNHDDETLVGQRRVVIDAQMRQALLSPLLAAFFWATAIFEERFTARTLFAVNIGLFALALGFSLRAFIGLRNIAQRAALWFDAPKYALKLGSEMMVYRRPDYEIPIMREDVIAIIEPGRWGERAGDRYADVLVATHPRTGRSHISLPPIFDDTPGALAERLMRWVGPRATGEQSLPASANDELPSKLYDAVAAGERPPGVTALKHGAGWIRRGPYASSLVFLAVIIAARHDLGSFAVAMGAKLAGVLIFAVFLPPLLWIGRTRKEVATRKGLSLVMTPAAALLRLPSGVMKISWSEVLRVNVDEKRAWSLLGGAQKEKRVVLLRRNAPEVGYDEAFLGVPAEVVASLMDAYRKGAVSVP